jgi:hypothetical protein
VARERRRAQQRTQGTVGRPAHAGGRRGDVPVQAHRRGAPPGPSCPAGGQCAVRARGGAP